MKSHINLESKVIFAKRRLDLGILDYEIHVQTFFKVKYSWFDRVFNKKKPYIDSKIVIYYGHSASYRNSNGDLVSVGWGLDLEDLKEKYELRKKLYGDSLI